MLTTSRTATRPIPATSTANLTAVETNSDSPNVGAIAGGTVGGVIALAGLVILVSLCVRSKHRQRIGHRAPELENTQTAELGGPAVNYKPAANHIASHSSTVPSPASVYSPYASMPPPVTAWHRNSAQIGRDNTMSELPDNRISTNAELSDLRSPIELPSSQQSVSYNIIT
jgi:hypothetical protein